MKSSVPVSSVGPVIGFLSAPLFPFQCSCSGILDSTVISQQLASDDIYASSICSTQPVLSCVQHVLASSTVSMGVRSGSHVSTVPLGVPRKPFKIARKTRSVTQLVLVDECDSGGGFSLVRNKVEVVGLTMPSPAS